MTRETSTVETSSSTALVAHPATVPMGAVAAELGIEIPQSALTVLTAGVGYLPVRESDWRDRPYGGFERAFDALATLGFHCETFRSPDPVLAYEALRTQTALTERRWRPLPFFGFWPERVPGVDGEVVMPAALRDADHDGVTVASIVATRRVPAAEYVSAALPVHGYSAAVPSMRAILSPARIDVDRLRRRALRVQLLRMRSAQTGVRTLESLVATADARELATYRQRLAAAAAGPHGALDWHRRALAIELAAFGDVEASEAFTISAALHERFLHGDDGALTAIAVTERATLDALAGRSR